MTKFETEFREKHKEDIELYEKLYSAQEGRCCVCKEWNPIHWLHMKTTKIQGAAPKLKCCGCFQK